MGLYLNPPDKAIVLSVDEKSQIQALDPAKPAASAQHRRPGSRATNGLRGDHGAGGIARLRRFPQGDFGGVIRDRATSTYQDSQQRSDTSSHKGRYVRLYVETC